MKDQLISFETAKLAKEKGFYYPCDDYYTISGDISSDRGFIEPINHNSVEGEIAAPTQSLLQKWLRDECVLPIYCTPTWKGIDKENTTKWRHNNTPKGAKNLYDTYEEALEVGLLDALNYIR